MLKAAKYLIVIAIIMLIPVGSTQAQGEAGVYALQIQPGARANSMGQCFVAISDDATGIWWNPGGMAFVNVSVDLMHSQLVPDLMSDVFYEYIGFAYRMKGIGTIGAAMVYLTYGDYSITREGSPDEIGVGSAWEMAPTVSGAIKIFDSIGIGMNLKFIYSHLASEGTGAEGSEPGTGHSVAIDIGGLWKVPDFDIGSFTVSRLNLGASVSNLGPSISYMNPDQAAPLPRNLRLGFSYSPYSSEVGLLTFTGEFQRPLVEFSRSNIYHAGGEFLYANLIAVRAGYVHDRDGYIKDPTYGLGFVFNDRYRLDWASIPQAEGLDRVQRWSIGITF